MSNGGTGRPAATLMRALSGWTLISLSEAQCSNVALARGFGVARSCVASSAAVPPSLFSLRFEPVYCSE